MSHADAALTPRHRLRLARLVVDQDSPIARAGRATHGKASQRKRAPLAVVTGVMTGAAAGIAVLNAMPVEPQLNEKRQEISYIMDSR